MSYTLTIGGRAAPTSSTFDVLNPFDETVVAACPQGTVELVDLAVQAARQALPDWAAADDSDRVAKLHAIADLIERHQSELSTLLTREQGKSQSGPGANFEVGVGSITPWNWPLIIATWHLMPAIRVGCTVVIKPSPFAQARHARARWQRCRRRVAGYAHRAAAREIVLGLFSQLRSDLCSAQETLRARVPA